MYPTERLKGIEVFVEAARAGSFTVAGQRLNLTNSAVGKSVGRLEARLGRRLFERTTRSLALTDAGSAFYAICLRVLSDLADAEAVLASHENEPIGRLKINVPVAFGRMQVMPLVLQLAERHPGLRPEVNFTDRFVDMVEENVDLAVRITASDVWPDALGRRHLGAERLIICASPGFIERQGSPGSIDDLAEFDSVLYGRADGSTIPWRITQDGASAEARVMEGRLVLGSAEAQVEAVKAGFGIAQLATWLIRDELERGELVQVLPEAATDGLPLHLVWPRSRQLSPKVDALITLLAQELRIR
ncbi:LysR family transcriptional regulator [Neorhizobium lilium]|uniref:HTH-type transcriptional regulator TtuA n=1 Tax=Neorhizobium lilium TaxID=2503024 RepID=A0A444LJ33_9HYPH|nr:LysR family transcriptional regulator [Neorhizobium lilium]RWX79056.1 LysR family transcriptional regulator [Neorhizobium lilium]